MIGGLHHMDESKHRLDRLGGHEPKATTKTTRRAALAVSRQVSPTQRCVPERQNREQILFDTADAVRDKSFRIRSYAKSVRNPCVYRFYAKPSGVGVAVCESHTHFRLRSDEGRLMLRHDQPSDVSTLPSAIQNGACSELLGNLIHCHPHFHLCAFV